MRIMFLGRMILLAENILSHVKPPDVPMTALLVWFVLFVFVCLLVFVLY